jgi:hypothetical protein
MQKLNYMFFITTIILCLTFLFFGTSCNSYFENKEKPDNKGLLKEEQNFLSTYKPPSGVDNVSKNKNIGDVESDLQILFNIPSENILTMQKFTRRGCHGNISRIEVEIPYRIRKQWWGGNVIPMEG